jgi:hypothetical protein
MDELTKLQAQSDQLAAAIKSYIKHQRDVESSDQLRANYEANKDLNKAKTLIHASMAKMKTLLGGPVELIQDLARQVCIPLSSLRSTSSDDRYFLVTLG